MSAKSTKKRARSPKLKSQARVIPIAESRLQDHVTSIGFEAPGIRSVKKLKLDAAGLKARLGGKASGLATMAKLGISVPPAINISTQLCHLFLQRQKLPQTLISTLTKAMGGLEKKLKREFGSLEKPLLVSVRSGARVSMPGMMDTILNLGLTTAVVQSLVAKHPEQARFWWDCYRRLIVMFADVVLGLDRYPFDRALEQRKDRAGVKLDSELGSKDLRDICEEQLLLIRDQGKEFPQDPVQQLLLSIEAVFRSWNTDRATHYRQIHKIPEEWGTAVTIQAMVFGNLNEKSGTGVVFTRNPSSGEKKLFGEYLINAQGEDVVAGIRTPEPIEMLRKRLPKVYSELTKILKRLEDHFQDVQDVEFTIEDAKLYILQTRTAKRTASATLEHLLQFVSEKKLKQKDALGRFEYAQAKALLHPSLKPGEHKPIGKGLPASPGAVTGRICLSQDAAVRMNRNSEPVILVRRETSPEDIMGMNISLGILTATGGMTSHAAVVGRGMGKTCIVGCTDLRIFEADSKIRILDHELSEGDWITLDGSLGAIYAGRLPTQAGKWNRSAQKFFQWADAEARMKVLANADTPEQAATARDLGAKGIGLCRTEHMFFEKTRLEDFRKMILSDEDLQKKKFAEALLEHQRSDFVEIFKAMKDLEVTVRLLDPPLHEFLPQSTDASELSSLARDLGVSESELAHRLRQLHEQNPMLGHRGCRLGITFPEIYLMQIRALAQAFSEARQAKNRLTLKIMIPLTGDPAELAFLIKKLKPAFLAEVQSAYQASISKHVKWGTMIEIPRACLMAGELARQVDFFSFGTNDLTQTGYGISRDDASKFLPFYIEEGIYPGDPFESFDAQGLGRLVEMAVKEGRKANSKIEIGVCGEHGGDPASIGFFDRLEFDSVSCSAFRVPIARMAAGRERETKVKK